VGEAHNGTNENIFSPNFAQLAFGFFNLAKASDSTVPEHPTLVDGGLVATIAYHRDV
jgi:hypothetical protein